MQQRLFLMTALALGVSLTGCGGGGGSTAMFPSGERILVSRLGGNSYLIDTDGTNPRYLKWDEVDDFDPAFSPDGEVFAFRRDGDLYLRKTTPPYDIVRQLTGDGLSNAAPAWSPDGMRLAFTSRRDGKQRIYLMNADGSGLTKLTTGELTDESPSWSPDGKKIVFARGSHGVPLVRFQICTVNVDGTGLTTLTDADNSLDPEWSPDGKNLVFRSLRAGNSTIYTMNADGSDIRKLTSVSGEERNDVEPTWSPDGKFIAFTSNRDDTILPNGHPILYDIFIMNADGSGLFNWSQRVIGAKHDFRADSERSPSWR